jgi:hypothetical protein
LNSAYVRPDTETDGGCCVGLGVGARRYKADSMLPILRDLLLESPYGCERSDLLLPSMLRSSRLILSLGLQAQVLDTSALFNFIGSNYTALSALGKPRGSIK